MKRLFLVTAVMVAAFLAFTNLAFALTVEEKHEKVLYPIVRVRVADAMGSGTIIYSQPLPGQKPDQIEDVLSKVKYETYVLTNKHVVSSNIKIADDSGSIRLNLWNQQIDDLNVGDKIKIENSYVARYAGELQLRLGRTGTIH